MSRNNEKIDFTWRQIVVQCLVVVAMLVVIVAYLPHEGTSSMHYEKGRPWAYLRFIAPYDFPVFKSDEQIAREEDSISLLFEPYFELESAVEHQQTELAEQMLKLQDAVVYPAVYRQVVMERLHTVYERGIVRNADAGVLTDNESGLIRVYQYTKVVARSAADVFTPKTAYTYLTHSDDSLGVLQNRLQRLNLDQYIQPNLKYDKVRSDELWMSMKNSLTPTMGVVMAGQSVIDRGDIVSEEQYQILQSYERSLESSNKQFSVNRSIILGQILFAGIVLTMLLLYFDLFRRDYVSSNLKSICLVVSFMLFFVLATSFLMRHKLLSVYVIPYAMLPIFVRSFLDSRTAFITHTATIFLASMAVQYHYEFIATQMMAGLVAIYSLRELTRRAQIFHTAFLVVLTSVIFYMSIDLIDGRYMNTTTLSAIDFNIYKHLLWSGVLILMTYPLMYVIERVFGFTSRVTLLELNNSHTGLLRKLSEEAPGTFQHSTQVGNLAAAVAETLGVDALSVRTGGLYHDIGKLTDPMYFTENLDGMPNPEIAGNEKRAAKKIIHHVDAGVKIAKAEHLPHEICDFIATHHGKSVTPSMYIAYCNSHPDEQVDPADFSYPGPDPTTKEQAILMMADAVEAASHSLKGEDKENLSDLVERIVNKQEADGRFRQCPITYLEIQKAKEVLKEKIRTMNHKRIAYPELKQPTDTPRP